MRTEEPRAIKLSEYVPPQYEVSELALDFQLDPQKTVVKATSKIEKTGNGPLTLNGEHLKLLSIKIDGRALLPDDYKTDDRLLTIADGTENRLLTSVQLIERVLAADISYTISRMRVLERIPGKTAFIDAIYAPR